jgi:hypothetical protein
MISCTTMKDFYRVGKVRLGLLDVMRGWRISWRCACPYRACLQGIYRAIGHSR